MKLLYISFLYFVFNSHQQALACSVCGFGADGSQQAFLITTAVMTFVPLILIGAIIFYIRKKL